MFHHSVQKLIPQIRVFSNKVFTNDQIVEFVTWGDQNGIRGRSLPISFKPGFKLKSPFALYFTLNACSSRDLSLNLLTPYLANTCIKLSMSCADLPTFTKSCCVSFGTLMGSYNVLSSTSIKVGSKSLMPPKRRTRVIVGSRRMAYPRLAMSRGFLFTFVRRMTFEACFAEHSMG